MRSFVFLSSSLTPHQIPFCEEMHRIFGDRFNFIQTVPMSEERKQMGWQVNGKYPYLLTWKQNPSLCQKMIYDADCVMAGSAPEFLLTKRIQERKLLLRYSERPLKKGLEPLKYLPRLLKWHYQNPSNKPIYMLCASGYTAGDYAKFSLFKDRTFKWGYFPVQKKYDIDFLMTQKSSTRTISILWAGRLIGWKHPDVSILLANKLKEDGYNFTLNIIGCGPLEQVLREKIKQNALTDHVSLLGARPPEQVRGYMEQSDIFLFTSDFNEGWGAVLNEAMNSGCAVVASHAIGAVPFLITHTKNGLIYRNGDIQDLYRQIVFLIEHPQERQNMGKVAYHTIANLWNAKIAAERLIELVERIKNGKSVTFTQGPCSPAKPILQKDMYEYLTGD